MPEPCIHVSQCLLINCKLFSYTLTQAGIDGLSDAGCFSFLFMGLVDAGYLEDRRPASNMDPYVVTGLLAETTILWEPTLEAEALAAQKLALNVQII